MGWDHGVALFGESVERCPVLLGGNAHKRFGFLRGVTSLSTTGGELPNEGVLIGLADFLGRQLIFGGALRHFTILPPEAF